MGAGGYGRTIAKTTKLTAAGPDLAERPGMHAQTGMTGFGLAGHALEFASGACCEVRID